MISRVVQFKSADLRFGRFDREHYGPQLPVWIEDGAAHWPALHKWSPSYFKAALGDKRVVLKSNARGVFDRNRQASTGPVALTHRSLAHAVDLIVGDTSAKHYLQQQNISTDFPELLADLVQPELLDASKEIFTANFWFGGSGCKSPLHYDESDNFLIQVFGRKRVILFPPACSPHLYPALGDLNPHTSRMNVFAPDLATFPLYATALESALECEIGPGNVLYIPRHWWHAVESIDVCASVNLWWGESKLDHDRRVQAGPQNALGEVRT